MKNKIIFTILFTFIILFYGSNAFADTKVNLQIKTNTNTIYDGDITVTPCDSDNDVNTPDDITAYCALFESGVPSIWSGLWMNSVGGIVNNDGNNGVYWMWLANLNIDTSPTSSYSLSAKQYILQNNDHILFYYNTNPLDVIVDNINPKVGDTIKITGKELGLDSSWNPLWKNVIGGKVIINGNSNDLDSNGEFSYEIKSDDKLSIKIQKNNFIDSKEITINPEKIIKSSGGSGSYATNIIQPIITVKNFSTDNALKFLEINQKNDGSYGDSLYTDWVAVGAGDDQNIKDKLIKYYKENKLDSNIPTDNERHAMALMALGINPYNEEDINYIKKIVDSFDGTQFGDKTLINDDIFGLIVLKNAGYGINDEIISKDINYIISKQNKDGSWGSVDMTSASIQALKGFENISGIETAISKAEAYIISKRKSDGSFENVFSTSWVLQTLFDNKEILKGESYLTSKQGIDGGVGDTKESINNRVWATAYAIPAISHKPWNEILNKFSKPEVVSLEVPEKKIQIQQTKKEIIIKPTKIIENDLSSSKNDNLNTEKVKTSTISRFWKTLKTLFSWLLNKLSF